MLDTCSQTITIHNSVHRAWDSHPVHYGVPWPEGAVADASALCAFDESGEQVPIGTEVLSRWPDGSVQWVLVDASVDLEPSEARRLRIEAAPGRAPAAPDPDQPVEVDQSTGRVTACSGPTCITLSSAKGELLAQWQVDRRDVIEPGGLDVLVVDESGKEFSLAACGSKQLFVEHATPLRAVLRIEGKHEDPDGATLLDGWLRVEVCAGRRDVKLTYHFRNKEQPTPGVKVKSVRVRARTCLSPSAERCITQSNRGRHYKDTAIRIPEDVELIASDTIEIDRYAETHTEGGAGRVFIRNGDSLRDPDEEKPWYMRRVRFRGGGGELMLWPYLGLADADRALVAAFTNMAGMHPKELSTRGGELDLWIWPEWAGLLSITQGAGRTHEMMLGVAPGQVEDLAIQSHYLEWELCYHTHGGPRTSVWVSPDIDHVRRCKVFAVDRLPAYEPARHLRFERKLTKAWLGAGWGQLGHEEAITVPPNGMWNFGDSGASGQSWSNNEEMSALPFFQDHLRSGRWERIEAALARVQHMIDVDHVAYSVDAFQNLGMCAHCPNHNDGAVYPSHMWFTELLYAYALTGDGEFRRTALRACENLLHWVNDPDGFKIVAADGREAGQTLINLTWVYRFNPDERYIEACRKIVRDKHMAEAERYGRTRDPAPSPEMVVELVSYGDYASWEGIFWLWDVTGDEEIKQFLLSQLEWRLEEERMGVQGYHRASDYNPAAYAFYMTGDRSWIERVARPFRAAFGAANWSLGWVHAMYYIKLAFEMEIVTDDDVIVS